MSMPNAHLLSVPEEVMDTPGWCTNLVPSPQMRSLESQLLSTQLSLLTLARLSQITLTDERLQEKLGGKMLRY